MVSELRKGDRCDARVAAWYAGVAEADLFLSVLVTGQIRKGIERVRPGDAGQANALERWLRKIERDYGNRILPVDAGVADIWGRLSAIRTIPAVDALLAATAMRFGLTLATRNVSDVDELGASVLNPFEWRGTGWG